MDRIVIYLINKLEKQRKEAKFSLQSAKAYLSHVDCLIGRAEQYKSKLSYGQAMFVKSSLAHHSRRARALVQKHSS